MIYATNGILKNLEGILERSKASAHIKPLYVLYVFSNIHMYMNQVNTNENVLFFILFIHFHKCAWNHEPIGNFVMMWLYTHSCIEWVFGLKLGFDTVGNFISFVISKRIIWCDTHNFSRNSGDSNVESKPLNNIKFGICYFGSTHTVRHLVLQCGVHRSRAHSP